jgi:hypothetical protein
MMNEIARAIANIVIFMEYSSPDILDEDASIQAMEQLAGDLKTLDANSRSALSASFRAIASTYDGEFRTFVEELPDALGIEELSDDGVET